MTHSGIYAGLPVLFVLLLLCLTCVQVSSGLSKVGYQYINIDDCWQKSRSSNGTIQSDPTTFPNMTDLIQYVHSKGLKFGLYSSAGTKTCAGVWVFIHDICIGYNPPPSWIIFISTMPEGAKRPRVECL